MGQSEWCKFLIRAFTQLYKFPAVSITALSDEVGSLMRMHHSRYSSWFTERCHWLAEVAHCYQ